MNKHLKFDVIVLGAGPGGYPAAIKAAQNGKKVALIEAKELGGTCLNRGCIPSKVLISNAETLKHIKDASEFGISTGNIDFDYSKMADRKDSIVNKTRKGLEGLIKSNDITIIQGFGTFISPNELEVSGQETVIIQGEKIIIATGSEPKTIAAFPFDYKRIHDSTSLLEMKTLPKSLVIIGGGVIGCEFASLYNTLGVKVTIIEMMPSIIPMESANVSSTLTRAFEKKGIQVYTDKKVLSVKNEGEFVLVELENQPAIQADIALIAVGRQLNTSNIGLDKAGVTIDKKTGIIDVNDKMETNVPGIYAIGDIASKWWLAHVATHQGLVAAANASGKEACMHYNAIPSVIFTDPEIGTVGLSLEAAKEKGYNAQTGAFPFQALGKSQVLHQTDGFAQIVIDKDTGEILGAQVVGYEASSLIAQMALAITNELTVESIIETIHAHPTISEAWMEAAFLSIGEPLHLPPKMKSRK